MMEFKDQHKDSIRNTLVIQRRVSCSIFDDKVRDIGTLEVSSGQIVIRLDDIPHLIDNEATGAFLGQSISVAIEETYNADPGAFEKT